VRTGTGSTTCSASPWASCGATTLPATEFSPPGSHGSFPPEVPDEETNKRPQVSLLDPFVVCSAVGGVLGHHRKSGLAFIFGKSRRPCRSRRTILQLPVFKIALNFV